MKLTFGDKKDSDQDSDQDSDEDNDKGKKPLDECEETRF